MTDPSADTASTLSSTAAAPIARRTVLAGSAFAVPAIMMAVSTPAFAASGVRLSFDKSAYSGEGCGVISGVTVTASDGATPKAGVSITVSLANGWTFASGGTSSTGVTGSGGTVGLPDINVPANGATGTASATSSGATSASATLNGTQAHAAKYLQNGSEKDAVGVPGEAIPAWSTAFLATDGRLIDGYAGGTIASSVDAFGQVWTDSGGLYSIALRKKDGSCTYLQNSAEHAATNVPAGSSPAWSSAFLTSDGRIVNGAGGGLIATNIESIGQVWTDSGGADSIPLKKRDGTFAYLRRGVEYSAVGIPSNSVPAWSTAFLAPDGRLIDGGAGGVLATNVSAFGQVWTDSAGAYSIPLKKKDGTCTYLFNSTEKAAVGVPSGSTPAWSSAFLTSDGRLIDGGAGGVIASNVDKFGQVWTNKNNVYFLPLRTNKTAC